MIPTFQGVMQSARVEPNLLIDPLPDALEVAGRTYPIETGFRTYILLEMLLDDPALMNTDKAGAALLLVYGRIPHDPPAAFDSLLWFYRCGEPQRSARGAAPARRIYDYEQDAPYIYAAFLQQYGLDLNTAELHWWKFQALFHGLDETSQFVRIMSCRAIDLGAIKDKEQRRHYAKLQAQFALAESLTGEDKAKKAGAILSCGRGNG